MKDYRRLQIESLEERRLLAVSAGGAAFAPLPGGEEPVEWVVNTTDDPTDWESDDGVLSLREALASASDGDSIIFDSSLTGGKITLNGTQLSVQKALTIDASAIGGITVDGAGTSRVFYLKESFASEDGIVLIGLTITGGSQAGVYNYYAETTFENCVFVGNTNSNNYGGGLFNFNGTAKLNGCIFSGNNASYGANIYNFGVLSMVNCSVTEGQAVSGGGLCNYGAAAISNTVFRSNEADYGGAIYNASNLDLTNVEISACSAEYYGGAVDNSSLGSLKIINCTIAGNSAARGGGIVNDGVFTMYNSILAVNTADECDNFTIGNGSFTGYRNLIGFDPGFAEAPVFESGVLVNETSFDLSLTETSWAIDRGDNSYVTTADDIRGNARVVASWKSAAVVDIGAYEYQYQSVRSGVEDASTVVTTADDVVDDTDGQISLREALLYAGKGETVTFDFSLPANVILLNGNELWNEMGISIDASQAGGVTIDADGKSSVFVVGGGSSENPVVFTSLTVTGGAGEFTGGGIITSAVLTLTDCTVTQNSAQYGGGIYSNTGELTLLNCTVSGNTASIDGGGIYNDCLLTLTNSLVLSNSAGEDHDAGGIYNDGHLVLMNCTVSGNYAFRGGGIFNDGEASEAVFYNCIISRNTLAYYGKDVYLNAGSVSGYNTLTSFKDWTESENIMTYSSSKPLFTDSAKGDYSLAADSQAINAGNNDYVTEETDILGNTRIVGGIVDLGAYEYQASKPAILTGTADAPYVSYGANRHYLVWTTVANADAYEIAWSSDGENWNTSTVSGTSTSVAGLVYGDTVTYKVRGIIGASMTEYSDPKSFAVCPMDVNGDGDISGPDRAVVGVCWLTGEGDDEYLYAADINGDGDVAGADRSYLISNWLCEVGEDELVYPPPLAASEIPAESLEFDTDLNIWESVF